MMMPDASMIPMSLRKVMLKFIQMSSNSNANTKVIALLFLSWILK